MSKGRYETGQQEGFEPGSNETVLKNKLAVKSALEMEDQESIAFEICYEKCLERFKSTDSLTVKDIIWIHREWLGHIYAFAGEYRTVNMSKGGFLFAAAHLLPNLMQQYEKQILNKYTPGSMFNSIEELAHALAVIHVEFIIIHPFREGNGRLGRLLCALVALQAGQNMLNLSCISGEEGREKYFSAIQAGVSSNYVPMETLFREMLGG